MNSFPARFMVQTAQACVSKRLQPIQGGLRISSEGSPLAIAKRSACAPAMSYPITLLRFSLEAP